MFVQRPSKTDTEDDLLRNQEKFIELQKNNKIELSVSKIVKSYSQNIQPSSKCDSIEYVNDLPIIERDFISVKEIKMPKPTHIPFPKLTKRKNDSFSSTPFDSIYENNEKLKNMSEKDIIEAKKEIMNHLSEESIQFLINRGKEKQNSVKLNETTNQKIQNFGSLENKDKDDISLNSEENLPISQLIVQQNQWLNMNIIEEEKLEWLRPSFKSSLQSNTARFSFTGHLVMEEVSYKEGLHHHGDEPERAGYTLSEIFTFIQSSFNSQKVIGLKILGNIMQKVYQGYYDQCFNISLAQEILDKSEILLVIRICLDENCETVAKEALKCLRHLICNTLIDEACLDQLFILIPSSLLTSYFLKPKNEEKNLKLEEITDQELIKLDVIQALLRCNILSRLRIFIESIVKFKKDVSLCNYIFDIMIRIARHSTQSIKAIIDSPYLLQVIVENFLAPKISFSNPCFNPHPKALKLFRIIFELSRENGINILSTFSQIIDSFQIYLTLDPSNFQDNNNVAEYSTVLQISIESLRIWSVLLRLDLPLIKTKFFEILPVIFRQLQYCLTLNSSSNKYDLNYAATLIKCIDSTSSCDENVFYGCKSLIQTLVFQFIQTMINNESLFTFDVLILIFSGIQYLNNNSDLYFLNGYFLNKLLKSEELMKNFSRALKKCSYCCQMKCNQDGCARDSLSLPSFGSLYFNGTPIKIVELVQEHSVFPLLDSILVTLEHLKKNDIVLQFLNNQYIVEFINYLNSSYIVSNDNIFKQIEIQILYRLSLLSHFSSQSWLCYYKLCLTLIHSINQTSKKEQLLNLVIFSPQAFENITHLNASSIINFQQIKEAYFKFSQFNNPFWIFDPIIECFKLKLVDEFEIKLNLEYFNILIKLDQIFTSKLIPQEFQFGLLSSVFIMEGRLYLNKYIESFLETLLKNFVQQKFYISSCLQSLPHISNFQTLFKMFISEYEFCASLTFTNYLLIFLQQKSDPEFRKIFFSDHCFCLKYIFLKKEETVVPIENFLFPLDVNLEIVELYLKNLLSGNILMSDRNPFYFIAIHHIHLTLFDPKNINLYKSDLRFSKLLLSIELSKNEQLKYHLKKFLNSDLIQMFPFACDLASLYNF